MAVAELMELAQKGAYDEFEARCLELLSGGTLRLGQLRGPFEALEKAGQAARLATLTQMVFENTDASADLTAALALARIALIAAPDNAALRELVIKLYRQAYGPVPGYEIIERASGISGGRPVRAALRVLDLCLALKAGDTLISRLDDHVVEVAEIDRTNGLFMLRRSGRLTTRPSEEVVREYERIASDDFRVLRQLRPEQLHTLIDNDPVRVVIGLIHAHGGLIDADEVKAELVPRHIEPKDWSSWWTKARTKLKRNPHMQLEGRSPLILKYSTEARSLEEETWDAIEAANDLGQWVTLLEAYLREVKSRQEEPNAELLTRFHDHLVKYITAIRTRRPAEALACALGLVRLGEKGLPVNDESHALAQEMLKTADDPAGLLIQLAHDNLIDLALDALRAARPDDWTSHAVRWLEAASANQLDRLAGAAIEGGRQDAVQQFVDRGLSDLPGHPELIVWLWKGPKHAEALRLPTDDDLLRQVVDTLSTLGRTVTAEPDVVKTFRHRMRAALAQRDYARVAEVLGRCSEAAAIVYKQRFERLEGMGDNMRFKLLDILRDAHPALWVVRRAQTNPWEDPNTVWCTKAGFDRRTAERDHLVNVRMRDNAKRIGEAASHGDLSENSEYKFALEERDFLRAQLANINDELSRARVLEPLDVNDEHVAIGTQVVLRRVSDGLERVMTFLGPFETDVDQGIFSYLAPMSQKVMGLRPSERVLLTLDGNDTEYEVATIRNALIKPPVHTA